MSIEANHETPGRTIVLDNGRQHLVVRRFRLHVTGGPDAGKDMISRGETIVIGKHESCDFVLSDEAVSRFHCEIAVAGERAVIRDLDSRNGTRMDGASVGLAYPRAGSILSIGKTQLRFDFENDEALVPLSDQDRFGRLVGRSPIMRSVFAVLEQAAHSDVTVLLEGETGTGKEAAAESLHASGPRKDGPFIVVDCGAIPPDLVESELFGHERGAFTGAVASRQGAFEAASGGTIFLDEIGELGPDVQPKLLRVLEQRKVKSIGSNHYRPVDVRLVAATHRNLQAEVNARRFRSDLYYRLAVLRVRLPPLRERLDDVPLLVEHILAALGVSGLPEATKLGEPDVLAQIAQHAWPGNVRELRNYVERCLALNRRLPIVDDSDEPGALVVDSTKPFSVGRAECLRDYERRYLKELLRLHDNNASAVARAAGLERSHLYRLLWRNGLR